MNQYIINEETLAIVSAGEDCTQVYENNQIIHVNKNVNDIMEESCLYFGSTLDGRKKATERLIGVNYKAPVIVEEANEIIFFPIFSQRYHRINSWIALSHIRSYYKDEIPRQSVIEFQNGLTMPFSVGYNSLDSQILRATRLESALRGRKTRKKRFK